MKTILVLFAMLGVICTASAITFRVSMGKILALSRPDLASVWVVD